MSGFVLWAGQNNELLRCDDVKIRNAAVGSA